MLQLLSTVLLASAVLAAPIDERDDTSNCTLTRDDLQTLADTYLSAQTAGNTSILPFTDNTTYLQNQKTVALPSSILTHPLVLAHNRSSLDTTQCATYSELIITDPTHPYVIGSQIRYDNDKTINHMETIVTQKGDWLFNASGTLRYASGEDWSTIPEDQRDSRAVIQAAADAYCNDFSNKSTVVPWGTPCERLEGGSYTGTGQPDDDTNTCDLGIPSGISLTDRRYVIDETVGACDVMMSFTGLPDSHEFRVLNGKLRYVHTLTVMTGSTGS